MDKREVYEKLVSVIVPVYNTKKEFILETLDSIANQTLDKKDYEILIVDDCSNNSETIDFLKEIGKKDNFKGVFLTIIRHDKNRWLAQTRITGAKNARGKYLVFLDSDDLIREDYLKKSLLLLESAPKAGWVYPNIKRFGYFDFFTYAPRFNSWTFFIFNYSPNSSLFRKSAWLQVLQREKFVIENVRFFEDWDTFIRLMAKGWYGLPLNDSEFYYRQHHNSLIVRSLKLRVLSNYVVWRTNIFSFLKIFKAQLNYMKDFKKGFGKIKSFLNPIKYLDMFSFFLAKKFMKGFYQEGFFDSRSLFNSFFKPKKFIKEFLSSKYTMTLAESACEFKIKPNIDFKINFPSNHNKKKVIMVTHPWWLYGGAENVLLNWIKSMKKIDGVKIIDLVKHSKEDFGVLKDDFFEYVDEQYSLDRIAETPLLRLKFCWNLIVKEQPDIIFISASSFFYALIPLIKKEFPKMKIIDILHSDEPQIDVGWTSISDEYKELIDKRIVITDLLKEVLIYKYKEKSEKIKVHKNSIDLKKYNPKKYDKAGLRKQFGINPKKFVVGFIGRFHSDKNPLVFVELANLLKDNPYFQFLMIGGGDLEKEIRKKSKLLPNIILRGYSPDISKYLMMCDVLICPSFHEGYPLISLEAAAMNIPVIATDINGFREQINKGRFGFLYSQKEVMDDAKKIRDIILENKSKFARIGKNGRKFVMKYHDFDKKSVEYRKFIESLLNNSD